jgi:hypothetical protein
MIMFVIEMVKGKDAPAVLCWLFEGVKNTAGHLLWMLTSYFGMCRYIILNSGFCVLKEIIKLKQNGLCGCPGDAMDIHFAVNG